MIAGARGKEGPPASVAWPGCQPRHPRFHPKGSSHARTPHPPQGPGRRVLFSADRGTPEIQGSVSPWTPHFCTTDRPPPTPGPGQPSVSLSPKQGGQGLQDPDWGFRFCPRGNENLPGDHISGPLKPSFQASTSPLTAIFSPPSQTEGRNLPGGAGGEQRLELLAGAGRPLGPTDHQSFIPGHPSAQNMKPEAHAWTTGLLGKPPAPPLPGQRLQWSREGGEHRSLSSGAVIQSSADLHDKLKGEPATRSLSLCHLVSFMHFVLDTNKGCFQKGEY